MDPGLAGGLTQGEGENVKEASRVVGLQEPAAGLGPRSRRWVLSIVPLGKDGCR